MTAETGPEWLKGYATNIYDWHSHGSTFYRRIGIVESLFDTDGTDCEGRADLSTHFHLEIKTQLSNEELRARILLAWAVLRQKHVLLSSRVIDGLGLQNIDSNHRVFMFTPAKDLNTMLTEAANHAIFLDDIYPQVDVHDFFVHTLNTGRCIDESQALSRFYVMPTGDNPTNLHFILIAGHQIVDGLTSMRWTTSFIDLVNLPARHLEGEASKLCSSPSAERLPPAQEGLYPRVNGSPARERWSWAFTRILRHVRHANPASFQNPIRREQSLPRAVSLTPKFPRLLDYSRLPPLNTFPIRAVLSPTATKRMSRICREAKISVGSGCFALVAIVMMLFEERRHPDIPPKERLPFVGSFPINPRPFLGGASTTGKEDSLMLAFSDGIKLPFLSSNLDLERRIHLLGKQAHRQLRQYQKRPRSLKEEAQLGSKSPTQLLPMLYLNTMEYLERKSQPEKRQGWNVQGAYPAATSATLATCGVSSVGARGSVLSDGKYDTSSDLPDGVDLRADFRGQETTVRARDGEFLVGVIGDNDVLRFSASYDGCAIDPARASQWKAVIESILEESQPTKNMANVLQSGHKL